MPGPVRRGRVSTTQTLQVTLDPDQLAAAVDVAVAAEVLALQAQLVHELRPQAVVLSTRGVTRAFYRTRWHWNPRTLNSILYLATLRG